MSKITNNVINRLTRSDTGCIIAVPTWQLQWTSVKGLIITCIMTYLRRPDASSNTESAATAEERSNGTWRRETLERWQASYTRTTEQKAVPVRHCQTMPVRSVALHWLLLSLRIRIVLCYTQGVVDYKLTTNWDQWMYEWIEVQLPRRYTGVLTFCTSLTRAVCSPLS